MQRESTLEGDFQLLSIALNVIRAQWSSTNIFEGEEREGKQREEKARGEASRTLTFGDPAVRKTDRYCFLSSSRRACPERAQQDEETN